MIETMFYLFLGAMIGWNLPQPAFAKRIQEKVMNFFKGSVTGSK